MKPIRYEINQVMYVKSIFWGIFPKVAYLACAKVEIVLNNGVEVEYPERQRSSRLLGSLPPVNPCSVP